MTHAVKVLHTEIAICAGAVAQAMQLVIAWRPCDDADLLTRRTTRLRRFAAAAWSCAEMLEAVAREGRS